MTIGGSQGWSIVTGLWEQELRALELRLEGGPYVCGCDPAELAVVADAPWAYHRTVGWHDPRVEHDAFWPVTP